ncbi:MAG: hypothetical protein Q7S87_10120 [Agitococcus sp.]|nr:hypothetical protein [Agitococcus sp.]
MKESSLHTTPLSRFIEMQVGRSWNTVYSEICAIFDSRKQANAAAFNLLDWRVTTRGLFMHEGNVLEHSPYRAPVSPLGLYVHPLTGLLCRNVYVSRMKRYKAVVAAREVEKAESEKTLSPTQKLIKDKGCWFLVDYAVVLAPQYGMNAQPRICRDVLTGEEFTKVRPSRTGNIAMYARAKRQLSKKEMKKFGVR